MKRILLAVFLLLSSSASHASEAMLMRFFDEVNTLRADFTQRVYDETGMTLEAKSGVFYLSRPGKFRWDYKSEDGFFGGAEGSLSNTAEGPPLGQQIVSDGRIITFYDPDLETANQRSMHNALEQVPTLLLVQSGQSLEKHFNVTDFGKTDGLTWVSLKPKDENAGYQGLMVGFANESLSAIVLTDGLGNETRLMLGNVKSNIKLPKNVFEFDAPEGVDVVKQ